MTLVTTQPPLPYKQKNEFKANEKSSFTKPEKSAKIEFEFDGKIDIATAKSCDSGTWQNRVTLWSVLATKLEKTHLTHETYQEFISAKKSRQSQIKDVGGFVGGLLANGKRKNGNVTHRQLLTLDIDSGKPEDSIWDKFCLLFNNAAVSYTTHSHSPDNPRLRLIIPIDRPVMADEYQAISRRIAFDLNVDAFDPTCFRPTQLMYWPSTSKDGEFIYKKQDGPWLSADYVLGLYHNWQDISEWPRCEREQKEIKLAMGRQANPLDKNGIVGAFCRTYNIHEAIETFLPDKYEVCDSSDRYTFKEGSGFGGLRVYDDVFAFSHHGTDPVSETLCNAYDLVRIHLFGLEDEGRSSDTPPNRKPSYLAMEQLARNDKAVKLTIGKAKQESIAEDFKDLVGESDTEEKDDSWLAEMDVDKRSNYLSTPKNVKLILQNAPGIGTRIALDLFDMRIITTGNLPWRKVTEGAACEFSNSDDSCLRNYLSDNYSIRGKSIIDDALIEVTSKNTRHSVQDWLSGLTWDGRPRVNTIFADYLGAENCAYTTAVARMAFVAQIARVFEPGCKYDSMPVLAGPQGVGKSTFLAKLGGRWYNESFSFKHLHNNPDKASEQLQGVWLIEVAELAGLRMAEVEDVKNFISRRTDRYRVIFKPKTEPFPRQCCFWGTTNSDDFLKDTTGNRRFPPIAVARQTPIKSVFEDLDEYEVNQIWAEATQLYKVGEPLFLSENMEALAEKARQNYMDRDPRIGMIENFLNTPIPVGWYDKTVDERKEYFSMIEEVEPGTLIRDKVCAAEIWVELFRQDLNKINTFNTREIRALLYQLKGWAKTDGTLKFGSKYDYQRAFKRVVLTNTLPQNDKHTTPKNKH